MTRLDMFIARMVSQRACLDYAINATQQMDGPVFELGLGNGRTYHHIRQKVSGRDIYVFERAIASHPDSTPPDDRVILGDVRETLPATLQKMGAVASVVHADLGGHNAAKNVSFAKEVSPLIEPLLAPGGLMVSSDKMLFSGLQELPIPPDAIEGRCFIYRQTMSQ